jgi:hypothetical protein
MNASHSVVEPLSFCARQQAEAMSDLRPDLQQRNQDRCEDRTKKDAYDTEHLNAAEDGHQADQRVHLASSL